LDVVGILGIEKRITLLVAQFIDFVLKGVEKTIHRSVNSAAVIQADALVFGAVPGDATTWKKVAIIPGNQTVFPVTCVFEMAFGLGMFISDATLKGPAGIEGVPERQIPGQNPLKVAEVAALVQVEVVLAKRTIELAE
jgi:hypothetical protein